MQCSEIREMLSGYIDDVLDPGEREAVAGHLTDCKACRQELADLQKTVNLLKALSDLELPDGFSQQLRCRLQNVPPPGVMSSSNGRLKQLPHKWRELMNRGVWPQVAAAAVIIGLAVGIGMYANPMLTGGLHSYGGGQDTALMEKSTGMKDLAMNNTANQKNLAGSGAGVSSSVELENMKLSRDRDGEKAGLSDAGNTGETGNLMQAEKGETRTGQNADVRNEEDRLGGVKPLRIAGSGETVRKSTGTTVNQQPAGGQNAGEEPPQTLLQTGPESSPQPGLLAAGSPSPDTPVSNAAPPGMGGSPAENKTFSLNAADSAGTETISAADSSKNTGDSSKDTSVRSRTGAGEAPKVADNGGKTVSAAAGAQAAQDRKSSAKLVRDGTMNLEVDSYKKFTGQLSDLIKKHDGYIQEANENSEQATTGSFTLRVPAGSFDRFITGIAGLGRVTFKQITARDVTADYVDAQARLRNLARQEQRLLALLDKSGSLGDSLNVETELGRVRGEIEVLQGKLQVLDNTVVYSTLRLSVSEDQREEMAPAQSLLGKAGRNFRNSVISIINMFQDFIAFIGWILPWLVIPAVLAGGYYYRKKKK